MRDKRSFFIQILAISLILLCSACNPESSPENTSKPDNTGQDLTPDKGEHDAGPAVPPGPFQNLKLILEDDFSDPESGWERYNEFDGILDYELDGYRMFVQAQNGYFWVNAGLEETDVVMEAEAAFIDGPVPNWYGLICRLDIDTYDYYLFTISSEGYYGIAKMKAFEIYWIISETSEPSEFINPGKAGNTIRVSCLGDQLELAVNGEVLAAAVDPDFALGDIGLAVIALDEPGVDVLFDNLKVYKP